MKTTHQIQSSGDGSGQMSEAVSYYVEDEAIVDYYDQAEEKTIGGDAKWLGELSKHLGLSGPVLRKDLKAMMFGIGPNGEQLRYVKQRTDQENRLAVDVCLSPPKSWSIAALVVGEDLLIHLHKEAVEEIATLLEERHAAARIQVGGNRQSIRTGNLAIAALTHYTARPVKEWDETLKVDPQLHTHLLIMNSTLGPDGKFRALHGEGICHSIGIDGIYKNILAQKLVEHGIEIRNTKDGFELASIPDEWVQAYSSRTNLAKALCRKKGIAVSYDNVKAMSMRSRLAKKLPKTLDEMRAEWKEQGQDLGLTEIPRNENAAIIGKSAKEMLESAIRHYSERSTHFNSQDLELYVFRHPQTFNHEELSYEIASHRELIPVGNRFTTHTALALEKGILTQWFQGQGQAIPMGEFGLSVEHTLNDPQRLVVEATLKSKDLHQIWQGVSGTGKTTSLGVLKAELDTKGIKVRGFAPGIKESEELGRELGIETNTVASLVIKEKAPGQNELWIIDESGKLSTRQLENIQQKAAQANCRLLLVGDKNQNAAIEAGSPFRMIQRYGGTTHKLNKVIRQQDPTQKEAVEFISQGRALESFELLIKNGYVNETADPELKAEALAQDYLDLSKRQRSKTLIVSGTNKDAESITQKIRDGLKSEGVIGEDVGTRRLLSRQLSTEEKQWVENYRKGDFLRIHRSNPNSPLKVGELYKVTQIHKNHEISLRTANGRAYRFSPKRYKNIELYHTQPLQVAKGDRLRWTHSDRKKGRVNGASMEVLDIKDAVATVKLASGKQVQIDLSKPNDVSHDWVDTSYRAQGRTTDRVLISATADPTSMREPFYVAISRQRKHLKVYTEDIDKLKWFIPQTNTQQNALDLINEQRREQSKHHHRAVRSLGRFNAQHPYLYSAVASHCAGAIQTHAQEQLLRQQFEGLTRRIQAINRRVERLNGRLTGQDHSLDIDGDEFVNESERLERRLDIIMREFDQELIDSHDIDVDLLPAIMEEDSHVKAAETLFSIGSYAERDNPIEPVVHINQSEIEDHGPIHSDRDTRSDYEQIDSARSPEQEALGGYRTVTEPIRSTPNQIRIGGFHDHIIEARETKGGRSGRSVEDPREIGTQWDGRNLDESRLHQDERRRDSEQSEPFDRHSGKPWLDELAEFRLMAEVAEPLQSLIKALEGWHQAKVELREAIASRDRALAQSKSPVPRPIKRQPFWNPEYSPNLIGPLWTEMKGSAIHPDIVRANSSLMGGKPVEDLLIGDALRKRTNPDDRESLKVYYRDVISSGIWMNAGYDMNVLATAKAGDIIPRTKWGTYKSFNPKLDIKKTRSKGKPVYRKYENPLELGREYFLPVVPEQFANRIYEKHGIDPSAEERQSGLYFVALKYNLPIVLTEGAKKTEASVSQGHITIGMQGVNGIYQVNDPKTDEKLPERRLNPLFEAWATEGRNITLAFDTDDAVRSVVNVRRALIRTVEQLEKRGVTVKVARWKPEQGKGLDDLIVKCGPLEYDRAIAHASSPERERKAHYRYDYNRRLERMQRLHPNDSQTTLDARVYLDAVRKGEKADGDRVITQSDAIRGGMNLAERKLELKTAALNMQRSRAGSIKLKKEGLER